MSRLYAILVGLAFVLTSTFGLAAEEEKASEKKAPEKKAAKKKAPEKKAAASDTAKVKVSKKFLDRWKRINEITQKKRAFEAQKTTTVAGVRGAEAEDAVLNQLYYKGGNRYPSRLELKSAITLLQGTIAEDPDTEGAAESKYFIAKCYTQLGDNAQAQKYLEGLIQNHADTEWAKKAKEALARIKKSK